MKDRFSEDAERLDPLPAGDKPKMSLAERIKVYAALLKHAEDEKRGDDVQRYLSRLGDLMNQLSMEAMTWPKKK